MSRGPGRQQLLLLSRVKRLRPGDPNKGSGWFYLADLASEHSRLAGKREANVYESLRRAAFRLAAEGRLQVEVGSGRQRVVIRPPAAPKSNTYELAERPTSNAYRGPQGGKTPTAVSVENQGLSVGLAEGDITALLWAGETVLATRGLCSQADRASLERVRAHFGRRSARR